MLSYLAPFNFELGWTRRFHSSEQNDSLSGLPTSKPRPVTCDHLAVSLDWEYEFFLVSSKSARVFKISTLVLVSIKIKQQIFESTAVSSVVSWSDTIKVQIPNFRMTNNESIRGIARSPSPRPGFNRKAFCLLVFIAGIIGRSECDSGSTTSRFQSLNTSDRKLPKTSRIAIIGAGVGGTGVAHYLDKLLVNVSIITSIDVFEKSNLIGGRLHTVEVFGRYYETGGSIIHPRNKHTVDLVKQLGLKKKSKEPASGFALLKDEQIVFASSPWKVITILRILWRYGLDFNHLNTFTTKLIDEFSNIYAQQSKKVAFETPYELLLAMSPGLANLTRSSFRNLLRELNLKEVLIDELVQAITFVNYGQDTGIHSLVGSIAVAGADDGLWSIENGNKQLPLALARASKANVMLSAKVESIIDYQNGTYGVSTTGQNVGLQNYDVVVVANPLEVSRIQFVNFTKLPYNVDEKKYHRTVATIIAGNLNSNFTMAKENVDSLFTCDKGNFFTTVGRIYPVDSQTGNKPEYETSTEDSKSQNSMPVYKVFSPKPLTENQLNIMFSKIGIVKVFDWFAYPQYSQVPEILPPFILDDQHLYYLNAIEWAASAIEMSLVSAKNIALLIVQRLEKEMSLNPDHARGSNVSNNINIKSTSKTEL